MAFTPRHPPYDHQRKTLRETIGKSQWALFLEMGTGKSYIAINTLAYWFERGQIDRAVYLAKAGEYANFYYDQMPEHWPVELPHEMLLYGSYTSHSTAFKNKLNNFLKLPPSTFKLLVANVESLRGDRLQDVMDSFVSRKSWGLIVDESTAFKNHKSKRSQALYYYAHRSKVRRIMTGTAVTESPLDLWGQALILGKGTLGHSSYTSFKREYCVEERVTLAGGREFNQVVGYKNQDKLSEVLKTFSTQILKKDCLDLPEKLYVKKYVELDPEHRKIYERLKAEAILELGDGTRVEVLTAMALSSKMHQLASGQVKDGDRYVWQPTTKLDALESVLEETRGKVIIFSPYRATLEKITERLTELYGKKSVARYYGGVPDDERKDGVREFQGSDDGPRFFNANQMSAGFGLTLTRAKTVVYFANSYRLELRLQSEDRVHRIGQTDDVTYVDIVAKDTVDEAVVAALRGKKKMSDVIMSRPMSEWL